MLLLDVVLGLLGTGALEDAILAILTLALGPLFNEFEFNKMESFQVSILIE